jgi:hypothetical protein
MEFMAGHSFASYAGTTDSRLERAEHLSDYIPWHVPSVAIWSFLQRLHQFWTTQPNNALEPTATAPPVLTRT